MKVNGTMANEQYRELTTAWEPDMLAAFGLTIKSGYPRTKEYYWVELQLQDTIQATWSFTGSNFNNVVQFVSNLDDTYVCIVFNSEDNVIQSIY